MPRRPLPYASEDEVARDQLGFMVRSEAEAFRTMILRSRSARRRELRKPVRKLTRGEAGAIAEVLQALWEVSLHDRRVLDAYVRFSSRYRDLLNDFGLNDGPTDLDPAWCSVNVGKIDAPRWFAGFDAPPYPERTATGGRRTMTALRPWDETFRAVRGKAFADLVILAELARREEPVGLAESARFEHLLDLEDNHARESGIHQPWAPVVALKIGTERQDVRQRVELLRRWLRGFDRPHLVREVAFFVLSSADREIAREGVGSVGGDLVRKAMQSIVRDAVRTSLA